MNEYKPWSSEVLERMTNNTKSRFPILDIQFGGACNLSCKYCDTPKYNLPCLLDIKSIERIIVNSNIEWIYACGLGEPTAGNNMEILKKILHMCSKYNVKLSMFSNMINLDSELLNYIKDSILYVLFKLDSFNPSTMEFLYGNNSSKIILQNYEKLRSVIRVENGATNLGASIVPTSKNYNELFEIIDYCMDNGIYPLIGELENAGKCSNIFDSLKIEQDKLYNIVHYINQKYDIDYRIPICPATISGIHITNTNKVIIDRKTGLSCGWFWLNDPEMIEIGDITNMTEEEIISNIIMYRKSKLSDVISIEKSLKYNAFGGCGGDIKQLFQKYINLAEFY